MALLLLSVVDTHLAGHCYSLDCQCDLDSLALNHNDWRAVFILGSLSSVDELRASLLVTFYDDDMKCNEIRTLISFEGEGGSRGSSNNLRM